MFNNWQVAVVFTSNINFWSRCHVHCEELSHTNLNKIDNFRPREFWQHQICYKLQKGAGCKQSLDVYQFVKMSWTAVAFYLSFGRR